MVVKATGESMNREFRNENDEVIVSSSTNVGINTIGSMTLTLLDAQKIKDSETIVEELKALIDDVLAMSAKYLNQKAGVMELEQLVEQHEDKLKQHDKELSRLNDMSVEMQKQMNDGLTRVDESNRFLREQNTRQSEQNAQILQAVIKGNESSDERQFQLKLLDKTNLWKLIFGIGGASAAIYTILMEVIKLIK